MYDEKFAHSCLKKFPCLGNPSVDLKNSGNISRVFSEHLFVYASNMSEYLSRKKERDLIEIAALLMSKGKGLLSADESTVAMSKYLQPIGLENNAENRRLYRQVLFTCAKDLSNSISGIIFFHETFYQTDDRGIPFRQILIENGIIPGIKVDKGLVPLAGTNGEDTTQGLDGLAERCIQYYQDGARFAKWRCIVKIGDDRPSQFCLREISNILGRYASICQQNGLVPILEIEISTEGDHDLHTSQFITEKVFATLYKALNDHRVFLEGTILQSNIVLPGLNCKKKYTFEEIAQATVTTLQRTIPPAVPGICFLLTGQSEEKASMYLNAINRYSSKKPWFLTFTYGRRLLHTHMLHTWKGKVENIRHAQEQLLKRMQAHGAATRGEYEAHDQSFLETNDNHK